MIKIIKYIFIAIGGGMLIGTYYLYNSTTDFIDKATEAQGTVVELIESYSDGVTYRPRVEFTTESGTLINFVSTTGSNPPSFQAGETVTVLYLAENPMEAEIKSFFSLWGAVVILGSMGAIFLLVGTVISVLTGRNAKKKEHLLQVGMPVRTTFERVELFTRLTVNGRSPFRIISTWENPETKKTHVFMSENIWQDPTEHVPDGPITVYFERDKPNIHYMDLSFLPESFR